MKLNITFKDHIKSHILNNNLFKTNHNSKYTLDEVLNVIEYILITGASWRSLKLPIFNGMYKWQSFYYHYDKFCKNNVFEKAYLDILETYFKNDKSKKLKYLSIDTSFIKNEYASNTNFGYCKKKKTSKLSLIVDSKGVPLSALLEKGNVSDQKLLLDNLNNTFVDIIPSNNKTTKIKKTKKTNDTKKTNETKKTNDTKKTNKINNKHKRYMLADSIYDTKEIRDKMISLNIKPIIWPNKRNTKNKITLKAANKTYPDIQIKDGDEFEVWGVITNVIHSLL